MSAKHLATTLFLAVTVASCSKGGGPTSPPPPSGPGTLWLSSVPGSARITLDGVARGYTRAMFEASAGVHSVHLSLLGYADTTVAITVPSQRTIQDTVRLRPLSGTPRTIEDMWVGTFNTPGPVAVNSTGTFFLTARHDGLKVVLIISPDGHVLHERLIQDLAADPAADIAVDSQGRAYVLGSHENGSVFIYDPQGNVSFFGRRATSTPYIHGIAIGPSDVVYVSALYEGVPVVEQYAGSTGAFIRAFETGLPFGGPIEVDGEGTIYLGAGPDIAHPQIRAYNRDGLLLRSWGLPTLPVTISRGPSGTLYVGSQWSDDNLADHALEPMRIARYTTGGTLQAAWGVENRSLPHLNRMAVDATGSLYLPLHNDERVLRFSF